MGWARASGGCEDGIPARLLLLEPASDTCAIGHPSFLSHVVRTVAEPLPQGNHAPALALSSPGEQGVELCASCLTDWGRESHEFLRELEEGVAQTAAETCPRQQPPHTLRGAVEAIGEPSSDPIQRLLLGCRAWKLPLGLGQSCRTGVRGVPERPAHAATHKGRQGDRVSQTTTGLCSGDEIDGQWETTPGQHAHQTVLSQRTHQTLQRHGRDRGEHCAQLHTQPPMRGQQRIPGDLRSPRAVTQDERRQDGEDMP
jgi:hypothetical protein